MCYTTLEAAWKVDHLTAAERRKYYVESTKQLFL